MTLRQEIRSGKDRSMDQIKANFHTHTTLCDGSDTPEAVAAYACSHGFTHLGFSGHMDPDIHMDIEVYYRTIRALQKKYQGRMDILRGIELDALYDRSCLYDAEYCIGSTHFLDLDTEVPMSVDSAPEHLRDICGRFFAGDYYAMSKAYFALEAQVFDRTGCTIAGHFDLITRFNDQLKFIDESDPRYLNPALEAMEYLVSQDVPFEINCGAVNRGRKAWLYPAPPLLKALHDMGGEIFISSDAHQKELLCGAFDIAVRCAADCGFTHTLVLEHAPDGSIRKRQVALDLLSVH